MQVHQLLKRGENHKDFCEDFVMAHDLSERYAIYGVFDGCSSGLESHFASALMAKIFRAELQFLEPDTFENTKEALNRALLHGIESLASVRNNLLLETDELLSTIILFLVDKIEMCGDIVAIGDGYVSINGQNHKIEQDNQPDYLAYYLDQINTFEDYENWLSEHVAQFHVPQIINVCISTDGIHTFQKLNNKEYEKNAPYPLDFLIRDEYMIENKTMLSRKCNILRTKYGFTHQDDIGIIRIKNNLIKTKHNGSIPSDYAEG